MARPGLGLSLWTQFTCHSWVEGSSCFLAVPTLPGCWNRQPQAGRIPGHPNVGTGIITAMSDICALICHCRCYFTNCLNSAMLCFITFNTASRLASAIVSTFNGFDISQFLMTPSYSLKTGHSGIAIFLITDEGKQYI